MRLARVRVLAPGSANRPDTPHTEAARLRPDAAAALQAPEVSTKSPCKGQMHVEIFGARSAPDGALAHRWLPAIWPIGKKRSRFLPHDRDLSGGKAIVATEMGSAPRW